jgi:hypothetical protein
VHHVVGDAAAAITTSIPEFDGYPGQHGLRGVQHDLIWQLAWIAGARIVQSLHRSDRGPARCRKLTVISVAAQVNRPPAHAIVER